MKTILKILLKYYLKFFTKLVINIKKPKIIVVAGSINKAFVSDAIARSLNKAGINARVNPKNFNTEIGLPLAVLRLPSGYNNYKNWIPAILNAPLVLFDNDFPKYLVLQLGTSDPGDMNYLLSIVKPDVAIITDITQRYLDSFTDMDELVNEYKSLVESISQNGLLLLNGDNNRILSLKNVSKCRTITFGTSYKSDWNASSILETGEGQSFIINNNKNKFNYSINKFGKHHIYASTVGLIVKEYVTNQSK